MTDWIKENLGKAFSAVAIVFTIIGFLAGVWREQVTLGKEIEKLQLQVQDLKDGDLWYIRNWISNPSNYRGE